MMRPLVLLLLLAGCVSRNNHELVLVQLDATRTAMSTHQLAAREEVARLEAQLEELQGEVSARDLRIGEEVALQAELSAELEALQAEKAGWLVELPAPPEGEEPAPLLAATVSDITDALAHAQEHTAEETRAQARHRAVQERFAGLVEEGWAEVIEDRDGSIVRLPVISLYNEGLIVLSPRGKATLEVLVDGLRSLPGTEVKIVGHTDDQPHHSAQYASSWELGFARAITLLRLLEEAGLSHPMSAASFAGTAPIASNETPEGRAMNARVELWLRPAPIGSEAPPPEAPEPEPADPEAPSDG